MTDVAILVPVLRRPHRVAPLLDNVAATTPNARVMFLASPEDAAQQDAVRGAGGELIVTQWAAGPGDYARKINLGVDRTTEPYVFLAADDIHFRAGWFDAAISRMVGTVGVVGTNDLGNRDVIAGRHATHSLVARWYTQHGHVSGRGLLHEGYDHNFVDNEFVLTAKVRQAWDFAAEAIVEHLHPSWSKSDWDSTYERGRAGWTHDRRLFADRRALIRRARPVPIPA